MTTAKTMKTVMAKIADLKPAPYNPRKISDHQREALAKSLKTFGAVEPAVVNADGTIIGGHQRVQVAEELGWTDFPVVRVDVTEEEAKALNLALNQIRGEWDDEKLAGVLGDLIAADFDMAVTGFGDDEVKAVLAAQRRVDRAGDVDTTPPVAPERVSPGEVWTLGRHRLMCGDAVADFGTLVDRKVDILLTDPPYGMDLTTDYTKWGSGYQSRSHKVKYRGSQRSGRTYRKVEGDDTAFDAAPVAAMVDGVKEQFWFGADYYRHTLPDPGQGSWLVWDKRTEATDVVLGSGFELVWSRQPHKRDLLRHFAAGGFGRKKDDGARVHPTQKPVAMLGEILTRWSKPDQVVLDLYGGSGSVLIAAEVEGRSCLMMELDTGYCDHILARWEDLTGGKAVKT